MITIRGHFDGRVIVPDEPVALTAGEEVVVRIESARSTASGVTGAELARLVAAAQPLWGDRDDMSDPAAHVNDLRRRIERREV